MICELSMCIVDFPRCRKILWQYTHVYFEYKRTSNDFVVHMQYDASRDRHNQGDDWESEAENGGLQHTIDDV